MDEDIKDTVKKLDDLITNVSKLWRAFAELSTDYWGPNKDNGAKSRMAKHDDDLEKLKEIIDELEMTCRHYLDAERQKTCYGVAAVEQYKQDQKEAKEKEDKSKTEDQELKEGIEVEKIKANSATIVQVLTLLGVLATAIIGCL